MKIIFPVILSLIAFSSVDAQKKTIDGKKIKEIKEWKIDSGKRTLSELSKYDANGERIEQIKYETNGSQKERTVFEYNANGKCTKEIKGDFLRCQGQSEECERGGVYHRVIKQTISCRS